VTNAKAKLSHLLDDIFYSHKPIKITGEKSNAILISEEDWRAIQETIYLSSIPSPMETHS